MTTTLLATAALGVSACGGDDALSKADFTAQVNKLCKDFSAKGKALGQPQSAAELSSYVDKAKPLFTEQFDKLTEYEDKAPSDVKDQFSDAVSKGKDVIPVLDELKAAGTDEAKIQAATDKIGKADDETDKILQGIGLTDCAADN